jgi:uncharacterized protein (UPF0276 family)
VHAAAANVGIGLRQPHYAALLDAPVPLGFVEVHSENFFADGGAALAVLHEARVHYDVSLHGVGLGLGSAAGLDGWHLDRLARLVQRIAPVRVSDHACFARVALGGGAGAGAGVGAATESSRAVVHANDLLPVAFTEASLDLMVANVMQVQERLARTLLVENLASYLGFDDASMSEPAFLTALCRRSGCGLLLDVNNLMVNALNAGAADPLAACRAFIDALPRDVVGELHVAGYADAPTRDAASGPGLVIDDHGSRVRPAVWSLCVHALQRFGPVPVLVEWDTALPPLAVLLAEAAQAAAIADRVIGATGATGA